MMQPLWGTVWRILKKLGIKLPYNPEIPLLGIYPESESPSVMSDFLRPQYSPGQNTGVGSLCLLQGIFPTWRSNPGLPHCRQILYQRSHQRSSDSTRQREKNIWRTWKNLVVACSIFLLFCSADRDPILPCTPKR